MTLVLDASSSISPGPPVNEQQQVKDAANAFLDGLKDTNSTARVVQFSGTSDEISPRRSISGTDLATTKSEIQSEYHILNTNNPVPPPYVYPGTNWESALWFTNQPVEEMKNGLVVFITDGDPTRIGTTTSTSTDATTATNAAIPKANDLKALGNRVLAVGVGSAINDGSKERLKKVSGPILVDSIEPGKTINDFDVLVSNTFSGLEQSLKNVASSLCGGAITIQKLTDEGVNGAYEPAASWNISAEVLGAMNPEDFSWIKPVNNTDEKVSDDTAPAPVQQGDPAKGTVQFQYQPKASWNQKEPLPSIRITETLKDDFNPRVNYGYRCEFPGSTRTAVQGDLTVAGGKASFDVPNMSADQRLSCLIYNKHKTTTLKLKKIVEGGGTTDAQWIMTASGPGNAPSYSKAGNHSTFESIWANTEYTLGETAPAGEKDNYVAGDWSCDKGVSVTGVKKDKITIPAGTTEVTCTITNSRKGELVVKKITDPKGAKQDFTFTPKGWNGGANFTLKDGEQKSSGKIAPGRYSVAESVPGGWTLTDITCDAGEPSRDGDEVFVDVVAGTTVTCEFKNTKLTAYLRLQKEVVGGSAGKSDWKLSADAAAPFDGKDIDKVPGDNVDYAEVYADTVYTLSESEGPAGYTAGTTWSCVTDENPKDSPALVNPGDTVSLEPGEYKTCTIVNTRDLGSLTISKVFDPKSSGYDKPFNIDYKCGDDPKQTVAVEAGKSKTIEGIPTGTECTVTEAKPTDPPAGWSFSNPVYNPADGKVKVTEKNQTVSVTVTNEIVKPGIKIVKDGSATQVNPGETVTYTYEVTNIGDTPLSDVKVSDDKCSPVKYQSGDTDGDSKLQQDETWIYTCSQPITVATTNIATATGKDKNGTEVSAQDDFTVAVVNPIVVKKICPIDVTLHKPTPKKVGNKILTDKIKTKKSSCVLLKPVVLCRPLASTTAGEKAFCQTKVTKTGRVTVKTKGYDAVRVTVIVRAKPKPGFEDRWKPNSWRKSWILR